MNEVSSGLCMDVYPLGVKDGVTCIHARAIVKQESLPAAVPKTKNAQAREFILQPGRYCICGQMRGVISLPSLNRRVMKKDRRSINGRIRFIRAQPGFTPSLCFIFVCRFAYQKGKTSLYNLSGLCDTLNAIRSRRPGTTGACTT